jgi:hypothetical protein
MTTSTMPRGLGVDGRRLFRELTGQKGPGQQDLLRQVCVLADELAVIRRALLRRATSRERRAPLLVELRQQTVVFDRLLNKLGRPVVTALQLAPRERFVIAKRAHAGGYSWRPEEWVAHAGHVPPTVPERFIPARLRLAAICACPPISAADRRKAEAAAVRARDQRMHEIGDRLKATD